MSNTEGHNSNSRKSKEVAMQGLQKGQYYQQDTGGNVLHSRQPTQPNIPQRKLPGDRPFFRWRRINHRSKNSSKQEGGEEGLQPGPGNV